VGFGVLRQIPKTTIGSFGPFVSIFGTIIGAALTTRIFSWGGYLEVFSDWEKPSRLFWEKPSRLFGFSKAEFRGDSTGQGQFVHGPRSLCPRPR
jgi:hypothetical protein